DGSFRSPKWHTLGLLLSGRNAGTMRPTGVRQSPPAMSRLEALADGRPPQAPVEGHMENGSRAGQEGTLHEKQEEAKKIRRLQVMISMVTSVLGQDPNLTIEEAPNWSQWRNEPRGRCFPTKNSPSTFSTSHVCNDC